MGTTRRGIATRSKRRAGFTLVEAVFAIAIIVAALLTTIGSVGSAMRVTRTVTEREQVTRAAIAKLAEIEGTAFDKVFATYDEEKTNDPNGPGSAPGAAFDIAGFSPPSGVAKVGSIVLPVVGTQLREDVAIPELGMPRDLNGDGKIDAVDHSGDYQLLPVLLQVQWKGIDGKGSLTIPKLLAAK